ncbi:GNAT family N-acetyltransferase [uncultured Thiodictyon sp.]|uniref:tRNA(Met) cytidine acetyltransferase TmcA n=1 Tax=uncultured Thiodictyon sp. TaxID=1846217 RepID=UPI0025DAF586|nr:GNAT family N-acetyltransferase [uncultured Thiodictyon sp.]
MLDPDQRVQRMARRLLTAARTAHHRLTLVLTGASDWTLEAARAAARDCGADAPVWLSDRPLDPAARPLATATQLLGGECDLLVYDAWSGFDPDGFGAATGTLRGGGLLTLLCPPLTDWPDLPDPQAGRIAPWPGSAAAAVRGRFIARLVRVLRRQPGTCILTQGGQEDRLALPPPTAANTGAAKAVRHHPDQAATPDQGFAIAAILRHARGRARRPLVLTAHRGRGKSAALGIAAARLAAATAEPYRCLVTAPRRAAVTALFEHAAAAWPEARAAGSGLTAGERSIEFMAPDALCQDHPDADLLLVDEAAGIPAPLLAQLLDHYPRVIFATTVHGYEGTGRGFDLRFRATLDRRTPLWRGLTLETPIRWAVDDPLEALVFRALLLDAAPATAVDVQGVDAATCRVERLDRDALAADDYTLGQVFGLLVLAHYQTRPLDLRLLLDAPAVRVLVLRAGGLIVGTLIAVAEGGMADPDLLQAIYDGRRRPRGHLLPLTLSAHAGLPNAPRLTYLRVIRIAVHPALARRGLGRRLLRGLFREARGEGIDLLGSSFGATPGLIAFWRAAGYRPVQLGASRNAASGEHALVVLRPVSARGWAFRAAAASRFADRLPVLLAGPLRRLDPAVAATVLAGAAAAPETQDRWGPLELRSFAAGHRTLDAALPTLAALTRQRLGPALRGGQINPSEAALLVAAAAQLRPVAELVGVCGALGQEQVIATLRGIVARLLESLDHRSGASRHSSRDAGISICDVNLSPSTDAQNPAGQPEG